MVRILCHLCLFAITWPGDSHYELSENYQHFQNGLGNRNLASLLKVLFKLSVLGNFIFFKRHCSLSKCLQKKKKKSHVILSLILVLLLKSYPLLFVSLSDIIWFEFFLWVAFPYWAQPWMILKIVLIVLIYYIVSFAFDGGN